MATIRPNAEPAATTVAAGDIFLIDGATGVRALAASSVPVHDANGNAALNNLIEGYATTATAAGTTTLTAASARQQFFTGTTTQTVVLPVTSTLALGQKFFFKNNSTGAVTIESSGANSVVVLAPGASAEIKCILLTGTTAASWDVTYAAAIVASGKELTVSNSLTLAGTDGTTQTFPTTSATIARTDAGQTFTGTQVFGALTATTINGGAVVSGTRLAKSSAYAAVSGDAGSTIALGGSGFYTLTFNAASGYPANAAFIVVNEDTAAAKTIAINGLTSFFLYPGQSVIIYASNNVWHTIGQSRWKLTGGTQNLYCDFTNGNDANDGLAAGADRAKKTLQAALDTLANDFDFSAWSGQSGEFGTQTLAVINMAASTTDTQGVHFSSHAFIGAQGGAAIKILGGTGSAISTTGASAIAVFCHCQIQLSNVTLSTTTSGDCISVDRGSTLELLTGVTFGACAGNHMSVTNTGSKILINNGYTVSGNATTAHMLQQAGGLINNMGGAITVTVSASITVSYWVLSSVAGIASLSSITFSLGAFTVTGKRYESDNGALIYTGGGGANYFPGTVAGTTSGGGNYV